MKNVEHRIVGGLLSQYQTAPIPPPPILPCAPTPTTSPLCAWESGWTVPRALRGGEGQLSQEHSDVLIVLGKQSI